MPEDELKQLAEVSRYRRGEIRGSGSRRTTDYIFDWDNMLAFEGNTCTVYAACPIPG